MNGDKQATELIIFVVDTLTDIDAMSDATVRRLLKALQDAPLPAETEATREDWRRAQAEIERRRRARR